MEHRALPLIALTLVAAGSAFGVWKLGQDRSIKGDIGLQGAPDPSNIELVGFLEEPSTPDANKPNNPEIKTHTLGDARNSGKENSERNRRGIEELEAGNFAESVQLFEEAMAGDPEEGVFQSNLAESLIRWAVADFAQDPEAALARMEQAIELAPDRPELIPIRDRWRTTVKAQAGFFEDQSLHFTLQYDGERSDLLSTGYREILEDLEDAYQDYGEFFDIFPVEAGKPKFKAVLYDREAFADVTGIGEWAGGAYDGTIRIPIRNFRKERATIRNTLRHELVHAFIDTIGGKKVDGWLNEGLAQYLALPSLGARNSQSQMARQRLTGQTLFALTDLQGTLAGIQGKSQVAKAYDQSMGFTTWLHDNYGDRTLVRMVQASMEGTSVAARFRELIGLDLNVVHRDFADSVPR